MVERDNNRLRATKKQTSNLTCLLWKSSNQLSSKITPKYSVTWKFFQGICDNSRGEITSKEEKLSTWWRGRDNWDFTKLVKRFPSLLCTHVSRTREVPRLMCVYSERLLLSSSSCLCWQPWMALPQEQPPGTMPPTLCWCSRVRRGRRSDKS